MSTTYHRFNNNQEVNAFVCGMNAHENASGSSEVMGPICWVVDIAVGERDRMPFFAAIVEVDDDIDTPDDAIPVVDHRDHV